MHLLGTSSAAPAAAGIALMIRQYFEDDQAVFWLAVCASKYQACSSSFVPSGVLVKAVLLHAGGAMNQYFDTASSQEIVLASPPDFIQGPHRHYHHHHHRLQLSSSSSSSPCMIIIDHHRIASPMSIHVNYYTIHTMMSTILQAMVAWVSRACSH